jgi:uncharacterized membrane protein
MKITSDLTNLITAILILTVQMFFEWTLAMLVLYILGEQISMGTK